MDIRKARDEIYRGVSIFMMCLRVTFYARVSTDKMEQAGSLENQVQYFTELIQKNTNWILVPGYVDDGISGTSTVKRDSFNRMIADARAGKFDFIITKEISRFSRNTLDSIQYTQELLRLGVAVLFQSDNLNTIDSDSEFRLTVMAGVAQDEVRKLSERLKFGFRQSIKNGRVLGNDKIYGYDKERCVLTINEEQAHVVRQIFEMYVNEGIGLRKISQRLWEQGITSSQGNPFNITTMKNILLNPKYKGWYCANKSKSLDYKTHQTVQLDESEWIMYPDASIPAIVSEELWDKANAQIKARGQKFKDSGAVTSTVYAYSGKIICAEHGTSFHRVALKSKSGDREIWQCKTYKTQGITACSAPQLRTEELDLIMAQIFDTLYQDKTILIDFVVGLLQSIETQKAESPAQLQKEETLLRRKKDKLLELSLDGLISNTEFRQRNDELNAQIAQLQERISTIEHSKSQAQDCEKIQMLLEQELAWRPKPNSRLTTSILDKIIVHNTGNRQHIQLDVHLKIGEILPMEWGGNAALFCDKSLRNITPTASIKTI
jgi:DNA invertase Pin-like site-specific DNA recombinase